MTESIAELKQGDLREYEETQEQELKGKVSTLKPYLPKNTNMSRRYQRKIAKKIKKAMK